MSALLDGLKGLGPGRLAAMAAVAVARLSMLTVLALRGGGGGQMALLYADLDTREAAQMVEQLDAQHVPHEVSASGDRIMVAEADVARARLLLAKHNLPSGGSVGYELFDRGDGLTESSFQQQINQARALEGELARTIRTISGVRAARVHLVLPRREPFAREQQEAQASVLLTMAGANRMDREGVQSVLNLVAAAVPGLRPQNIAVVDSRGDLLARPGEVSGPTGLAEGLSSVRRSTELRLARAVEEMLERTLGPGRVRAEASVDLDFAQVHESQERYDPDGQVVRSTQSVSDTGKTTEAPATVSVQNNLPNADAGAKEGAGSQNQRQEDTTNYEIGKTVRTLVRDQPEIRRISLAVLVDGQTMVGNDGKTDWKPRSPDELERLAVLVRGAIGFDEKRGDKVDVVNLRFTDDDTAPAAAPRRLLGLELGGVDVARLAQIGVFGLLALLALLLVLRPMAVRLTASTSAANPLVLAQETGASAGVVPDALLAAPGTGLARLPAPNAADGGEDDGLIDLANVEGQMRASSIRQIANLVDRHPEESLSIVRSWMQQELA